MRYEGSNKGASMHAFRGESTGHGEVVAGNNLLGVMSLEDSRLLEPLVFRFHGTVGDVLLEPGGTVRYAYFPCGPSLISCLVILRDGRAVETALIGREGAVGGIVSQGRLPAYAKAEVQFAGPILRVEIERLEEAKARSLSLRHLFVRYADCLMAQMFQAVACNAAHSIEQRAAKWLVSAMERTGTAEISLTQEQLAAMLGVGRSYISRVLGGLKSRNLIGIRRGRLVVSDYQKLKGISCECNDCVRRHFDDVLRGVYPLDEPAKMTA